ncbi:MAG: response regulator [Verrucomicrobia bacterium]|nr:response regulator [Verrucomicrobiota bacterium]
MTRVLIVDDKPENRYLLRALLQGHGCEVDEARHGAEALVKARQSPPQLIISDLLMSVMDGYTLLRQWKADERLKQIPFVVYTATYIEPKDEKFALDLGADAFIVKPAEPEPFMARIREVLAKAERHELSPARAPHGEEKVLLKEYSEVLIRKMEEKMLQLEQANRELAAGITERERAEVTLRALSLQLSRAEEEERRRIARELHDSTGQKLAALSMTVGLLQDATSAPADKSEKMFADCLAMIEQCAQEIRTVSYLLHPPLLDELGLAAALGDYVEGFSKRSGVQVALDAPPDFERLPDEVEIALFRIVQESLGNIHRHAGASTARIRLACDAEQVTLEVSDEGRGMSAETLRAIEAGRGAAGVGIAGMRERLRLLGGRLEIESGGQGTTMRAIIPRRQEPT